MSLTLFLCEVEQSEKGWPKQASLQKSFLLSTFGSFAALGLHSCRALSSTCCTSTLTKGWKFPQKLPTKKTRKNVLPPSPNVLPIS